MDVKHGYMVLLEHCSPEYRIHRYVNMEGGRFCWVPVIDKEL